MKHWLQRTALTVGLAMLAGMPAVSHAQQSQAKQQQLASVGNRLSPADRNLAHDIFKQLIEINTTLSVGSTTQAAEAMRQRLITAGFPAQDLVIAGSNPRRMNLVVRYRAGEGATEKPVLIIGHLDVVEARREDWTVDPFVFLERDGYYYGRGTQDMKCDDAEFVMAFIQLKKAGFVPKRDFILALTADEESGADNGVDWLVKNRPDLVSAAFAMNPDSGGLELQNGEPRRMLMEATEKVYADFDLTATNPGGHSSLPMPDNAIDDVAAGLLHIQRAPFPAELNEVTRAYLVKIAPEESPKDRALIDAVLRQPMDLAAAATLSEDPHFNALLHTTCVATMFQAGHAPNALPGDAHANVNCRILPGHSAEDVRQRLVAIVSDAKVTVSYKDEGGKLFATAPKRFTMAPPPLNTDLMSALKATMTEFYPGLPIIPVMESGASDSVYTMQAGIPSYGFSGIGIDADDERAHGRDERLRVPAYYAGVEFTEQLMRRLGSE
jgi:acetylornithine deacetylase/succinyl-diaminopimelate desuccinylase-like protein